MKTTLLLLLATAGAWAALCAPSPARAEPPRWITCSGVNLGHLVTRQTEVAVAYDAYAVPQRYAYYRTGHAWLLTSRYRGSALTKVRSSVAGYPLEVRTPRWCVRGIRVRGDLATLSIRESWYARWSKRSFTVTNRPATVVMRRVPGIILHKWVVVSIR